MSESAWSAAKLIALHQSFLEMRQLASVADRRASSFRIVACQASMARLEDAAFKCPSCPVNLHADILQEATMVLTESLSTESIHYSDQGADEFGKWYWACCYHACLRAARNLNDDQSKMVSFVDMEELSHVIAPPQVHEHTIDLQLRAIAQLPQGPILNAVLDWRSGMSVGESAQHLGVSTRTVDRLRERGREMALQFYYAELANSD
jgi:DNA-directed RNA polymerase specialized sigma24 family protein